MNISIQEDKRKEISGILEAFKPTKWNNQIINTSNRKSSKAINQISSSNISTGFNSFNYNPYINYFYGAYPMQAPIYDGFNSFAYPQNLYNQYYNYPYVNSSHQYNNASYSSQNLSALPQQVIYLNNQYTVKACYNSDKTITNKKCSK